MTEHYFTTDPSARSDEQTWTFRLRGKEFHFTSDAGVFSRNTVDFGSRLLIDTFKEPKDVTGDFLDMGCGYGPIGLSLAATFRERTVEMVDVNQRALNLAKRNAKANGISNVRIYLSSIYKNISNEKKFAAIVINPPIRAGKETVHQMLSEAYEYLANRGTLTVVVQKKQGAPSAEKKMESVFGNVEVIAKDKGYWIIQSIKE